MKQIQKYDVLNPLATETTVDTTTTKDGGGGGSGGSNKMIWYGMVWQRGKMWQQRIDPRTINVYF